MNSLEFINIEIAIVKSNYKKHIRFGQTNLAIADENRLKYLQQIKNELEVWYICKQHAHINKYEDINKNREKERFDITIWLNTENCDFESCASYEDCLKVRKALEVNE